MRKSKCILAIASLGVISLASCQAAPLDLEGKAPDYSSKSGEFITFAYASPTDGSYTENGIAMSTGEDYRTVERYREYKEAGLNTMLIQGNDPYNGEDFATSQLKKNMDMCLEAGISRCIVFDSRIQKLSASQTSLIGEGAKYATQEELNEYVSDCMKDYSEHDAFYGVMILDEPTYKELPAFGEIYKAIKANKDCYIEANLLPFSENDVSRYTDKYASMSSEEAYQAYLDKYIECAAPDKILMDSYPMRYDGTSYSIFSTHLRGLQMLANTAKRHGIAFEAVAQTYGATTNGAYKMATPTFSSMEWQMNAYMGFGVETFGYFTYWRKQNNSLSGEWFTDGTSYITQYGEKTNLYYAMQTISEEMQDFAPVITNFDYSASSSFVFAPVAYPTGFANMEEEEFALFDKDDITANSGSVALVTELEDKSNDQKMYMVMNALDPDYKKDDQNIVMDYKIDFGTEYNAVAVYYRGERYLKELDNGVYSSSLDAGYAEYIMPFKA